MSIIGASVVRRWGGLVTMALILTACGSSGGGSGASGPPDQRASSAPPAQGASSAPFGIGSVAWPTDQARIEALVRSLPSSLGQWTSTKVEYRDSPASASRTWKDGSGDAHYPYVDVTRAQERNGPVGEMLGLLMWAGGPEGCIDWASSPSLAAVPKATSAADLLAPAESAAAAPSEFVWYQCTSVVNVDGGPGRLPPRLWEYLLVWTAGDWVYTVDGRGADQRQELTELLKAGVTKPA